MDSVTAVTTALTAAPAAEQQAFLENYIAVRLDDGEITQNQLDDPAQWATLAPDLIEIWAENTREALTAGVDYVEEEIAIALAGLTS